MQYRVTLIATLFALALSLYNYTGYDPHNLFFFMFSIPAWFVDLIADVHNVSVMLMYAWTVVSYALIGYAADRLIARQRMKKVS